MGTASHANGWRSVVVQSDENWYTGYALPTGDRGSDTRIAAPSVRRVPEAAEENVPTHRCTCPDWREVLLPHELGSRQPLHAK